MLDRLKKTWTAYKNVAAVRGFLQWIGRWPSAVALVCGILAWLWSRVKHLPGPLQLVVGLGIFTFILGCIRFGVWVSDRAEKRAAEQEAALARIKAQEPPANRPQLLIVKWGQIDEATYTTHNKAPHIVQHGFFIRNFGLGETAIGVRVKLPVPTEVPDVWMNGEGSTPSIAIGKDQEVFVPLWRKMGGFLLGHVLSRFDLREFLVQTYNGKFGNKEIPVTIRYSSSGKRYVTTQNLIYSPEQRDIVGFGDPEQKLDTEPSQ